ncbi:MAG: hypothetical protein HZA54_08205 [Planctomycetes bacterium]|nr:hypothetical protein [Planctomycetota bacterium]
MPLQRSHLGGSLASVVLVSRTRTRTRTPWAFEYEDDGNRAFDARGWYGRAAIPDLHSGIRRDWTRY